MKVKWEFEPLLPSGKIRVNYITLILFKFNWVICVRIPPNSYILSFPEMFYLIFT